MIRALLLALCLTAGCSYDTRSSDCVRLSDAMRNAADRCDGQAEGASCDGATISSTSADEINACVAWLASASCDDIKAHHSDCVATWLALPL